MTTNNDRFYDVMSYRLADEYEKGTLGADAYHEALFQIAGELLKRGEIQSALRTIMLLDRTYLTSDIFQNLASEDEFMFNALKSVAEFFPSDNIMDQDERDMPLFVQGNKGMLS